jgi:hypothetical protein
MDRIGVSMNNVKGLYEKLRALPWPALVPSVGDCAFYESLLAGCADRMARGRPVDVNKIPAPDGKTVACVRALRAKNGASCEECAH